MGQASPNSSRRVLWGGMVLLLLLGGAAATQVSRKPSWPEGVPWSPDWQVVAGDRRTGIGRLTYDFYVDPARGSWYAITHYQLEGTAPDGSHQRVERLAWNRNPGVREPLLLFRRSDGDWTSVPTGSQEYRQEMLRLSWVYLQHREAVIQRSR